MSPHHWHQGHHHGTGGGWHPHHHHQQHWQPGYSGQQWDDPGWADPMDGGDGGDSEFGPLVAPGAHAGQPGPYATAGPLSEVQEMEYASELMEVASEAELEEFLGDLIKTVSKAAGGLIGGPVGQALTGALKSVAKQALPMVGGALGTMIAPGAGTALGSQLGSMAGGMFELEGLGAGQPDFAAAHRYVQLASQAAQTAALAPPDIPPHAVAHEAVAAAADHYGPGAAAPMADHYDHYGHYGHYGQYGQYGSGPAPSVDPGYGWEEPHHHHHGSGPHESGHWVRRGRKVILYGV
jgi:uncharacterized protein (DUF697 family)